MMSVGIIAGDSINASETCARRERERVTPIAAARPSAVTRSALTAATWKLVKVGPEFFGDTLKQWEEIWLKRTPVLADLRREAAAIK